MSMEKTASIQDMSSRENMNPLLEALQLGDFERARTLTPEYMKLIGYEILQEPTEVLQYGAYAADYWYTMVPPGIYPIFATEYAYHADKEMYTNTIKSFNGLRIWKEGTITKSSDADYYTDESRSNVIWENPYAFTIGKIVFENPNSNIKLLPPFQAEKIYFSDDAGDLIYIFQIKDTSLPEFMYDNPMTGLSRTLDYKIASCEHKALCKKVNIKTNNLQSNDHLNK